jgi:hypothetical protein
MFIFRWIKRILFLGLLIFAGWYLYTNTSLGPKVRQYYNHFTGSDVIKEGSRDIRTWAGELLKGAGENLQDGITDEDRSELNKLFEEKLTRGYSGEKRVDMKASSRRVELTNRGAADKGESRPKTTMAEPIKKKEGR